MRHDATAVLRQHRLRAPVLPHLASPEASEDGDPSRHQLLADAAFGFRIFPWKHLGEELQHRDLGTEPVVRLSELEPHGPTTQHRDARWEPRLIVGSDVGEEASGREPGDRGDRRDRPHGEYDAPGAQPRAVHVHLPRSGKPCWRQPHVHPHGAKPLRGVVRGDAGLSGAEPSDGVIPAGGGRWAAGERNQCLRRHASRPQALSPER